MDAKFQHELKALSERKRRTFLRYLERLEKSKAGCLVFYYNFALYNHILPLLLLLAHGDAETGEDNAKSQNWMEEAEKRLELLKLEVEKEAGDEEDEDDWEDSDEDEDKDDFSDDDSNP